MVGLMATSFKRAYATPDYHDGAIPHLEPVPTLNSIVVCF